MKKVIGWLLLLLPFIALLAFSLSLIGINGTAIVLAMVGAIVGCIWLGVTLLHDY